MIKKLLISLCFLSLFSAGMAFSAGKINVNTASADQLQTIKGIGPKTADDIITYRKKNGDFKNIGELVEVNGIGDKKMETLTEELTVKGGG